MERYTAIRNIHGLGVSLGVNPPANGKRFGRMGQAFQHHAAYWGGHGEWFIIAAQHRDSDSLSRSNFAVLMKRLGGESDTVAVERASHWAVGWVEYLVVHPHNRKGMRAAILAHSAYQDYPALDDYHWSELEWDEGWEFAKGELSSRFGKQFEHRERVFSEECKDTSPGDESAWWEAIERARERLDAIEAGTKTLPPLPDPNQLILF